MSKSVEEIAEEFGLPADKLEDELTFGQRFHDVSIGQTETAEALDAFASQLRSLREAWDNLSQYGRQLLRYRLPQTREPYFRLLMQSQPPPVGEDASLAAMQDRLEFLDIPETIDGLISRAKQASGDIREFRDNYVGRGRALELIGLRAFTLLLKKFWLAHKDERFGCRFDERDEPDNEASRFLVACVQWLDRGYTKKNCKQVMRKANEGERMGGRAEPPAEPEPDPTAKQLQAALDYFLYKKPN